MIALIEEIVKLQLKIVARDAVILGLIETVMGASTAAEAERLLAARDEEIEAYRL